MFRPLPACVLVCLLATVAAPGEPGPVPLSVGGRSWLDAVWGTPAATPGAGAYAVPAGLTALSSPAGMTGAGSATFPGSLTVEAGGTLSLRQSAGETATVAGSLILDGGTARFDPPAQTAVNLTPTLSAASIQVSADSVLEVSPAIGGANTSRGGAVTLSGSVSGAGRLTIRPAAGVGTVRRTVAFTALGSLGALVLDGTNAPGALVVAGTIALGSGALEIGAGTRIALDANVSASRVLLAGQSLREGSYAWSDLAALGLGEYFLPGGGTLVVSAAEWADTHAAFASRIAALAGTSDSAGKKELKGLAGALALYDHYRTAGATLSAALPPSAGYLPDAGPGAAARKELLAVVKGLASSGTTDAALAVTGQALLAGEFAAIADGMRAEAERWLAHPSLTGKTRDKVAASIAKADALRAALPGDHYGRAKGLSKVISAYEKALASAKKTAAAAGAPPKVEILAPSADLLVGLRGGGPVTIRIEADDLDSEARVDLFADRDGNLLTTEDQVQMADDLPELDGAAWTCEWDPAGTPFGTYLILARITDGRWTFTVTAAGKITLDAAPSLTISAPSPDRKVPVAGPLPVTFQADDPDDTAMVRLFLDSDGDIDTTADRWALNAAPMPDGNGALLNVPFPLTGMAPGAYHVLGIIEDGTNLPVTASAPGRALLSIAPSLSITAPATALRTPSLSPSVTVTWQDNDPDDVAQTSFWLDVDGSWTTSGDRTSLTSTPYTDADGGIRSNTFDLTGVPAGTYHVIGSITDGTNVEVRASAPGTIQLNVAPTLTVAAPVAGVTVSRGGIVEVEWQDNDPDDVAQTRFFIDADGDLSTTGDQWSVTDPPFAEANDAAQKGWLDLTGIPEGTWYILATSDDGLNAQASSAATGLLTLNNQAWAKRAGGSSADRGLAVGPFVSGSWLATGKFQGSAKFGPTEVNETSLSSAGSDDAFLAMTSPQGLLGFAKRAGGTGADSVSALASLSDGSCLLTGSFSGTATFGAGETNQTALTSAGGTDLFVARYDPAGLLAWAKRAGGTGAEEGLGIVALADGSCLVPGYFAGTATFGSGETNQTSLTSAGSDDVFLASFASDGTLSFVKRAGGTGADRGLGIAVLGDGSCFVSGYFNGTATFGSGETAQTLLTSAGSDDVFVAKFASSGQLTWAKAAGGTSSDQALGVAALTGGSCLVTGTVSGTATFGSGETNQTSLTSAGGTDVFVAQFMSSGSLAWASRAGGTGADVGRALFALAGGTCVVTGEFNGTATFGPGESGQTSLTSAGNTDIFTAKYMTDGSLRWAKRTGGTGADAGLGLFAVADGSFMLTGYFTGSVTFGSGDTNSTALSSGGSTDVFLARTNGDGGF